MMGISSILGGWSISTVARILREDFFHIVNHLRSIKNETYLNLSGFRFKSSTKKEQWGSNITAILGM